MFWLVRDRTIVLISLGKFIAPDSSLSGSVDLSNEYQRIAYMLGSKTARKRYDARNITVENIKPLD